MAHIDQKTVGYATRDGANVEIASEAAKVRRPLLSVDSYPAVRTLSMKRQNGHFWLPLARCIETPVIPVMVAPMLGAAEGQDVDEKMDEEAPVEERSARVGRKPGEPTPEE